MEQVARQLTEAGGGANLDADPVPDEVDEDSSDAEAGDDGASWHVVAQRLWLELEHQVSNRQQQAGHAGLAKDSRLSGQSINQSIIGAGPLQSGVSASPRRGIESERRQGRKGGCGGRGRAGRARGGRRRRASKTRGSRRGRAGRARGGRRGRAGRDRGGRRGGFDVDKAFWTRYGEAGAFHPDVLVKLCHANVHGCAADKVRVQLLAACERAVEIAMRRFRKRLVTLNVGDISRLRLAPVQQYVVCLSLK